VRKRSSSSRQVRPGCYAELTFPSKSNPHPLCSETVAPTLTQVYAWSIGDAGLPEWSLALQTLGKAFVGALVAALLRWIQLKNTTREVKA